MESINYKLFPPEVECVNVAAFLVNGAILSTFACECQRN